MIDLIYVGLILVDPKKVVAVERGAWSDADQDWSAIIVTTGGVRLETGIHVKQAIRELATAKAER